MGGGSSFIGLVYSQLRAWNRLSIFIAFFALIAVAVALDGVRRVLSTRRGSSLIFGCLLALVFVIGLLDQTSGKWVPAYEETASRYHGDRQFVRMIERRLPGDSAVFELPYASFPEFNPPPPGRTVVYDLLRPYLHSDRLRWSFGAMHGRPADWAAKLADEPPSRVLPLVSALGFAGIYLDRLGYSDDAAADEAERDLSELVGRRPVRSDDGRLSFFDLRGYNERLRRRLSPQKLARLRMQALAGE
jgi:phosphoglycerol transferase